MSFKTKLISRVLYALIYLLKLSYRIEFKGVENLNKAKNSTKNKNVVLALWHEDLLAGIIAHSGQQIAPLTSLSKDGDIASYILEKLNYPTVVRGSSSRGGQHAMQSLEAMIQNGYSPAITVDGPKGPRHSVKSGVLNLAFNNNIQIVGFVTACKSYYRLNKSWDKSIIPKPFSKIIVHYSSPINIDSVLNSDNLADYKEKLQQNLFEALKLAKLDL